MTAVRALAATDEAAWRPLWDGYCAFYETHVPAAVTAATWARVLDPASGVIGRAAVGAGDTLLGFSLSVVHPSTWQMAPSCYLEDLFVNPARRGAGAGRALIDDLVALAGAEGWGRLYWHTRANNMTARRLYDRYGAADDFVRYRLSF